MHIRDMRPVDCVAWRRLWEGYNRFYETDVPPEVTDYTFQRIIDPERPLIGRVADRDGRLVGMTVSVLHEGTWSKAPTLYLEDLFVDPNVRGSGIGRALLADTIAQAETRGCHRLYWHTREDNTEARRLYDTFVAADGFVRYLITLDASVR